MARKQVERNKFDPEMFVVTYTEEHNHHPLATTAEVKFTYFIWRWVQRILHMYLLRNIYGEEESREEQIRPENVRRHLHGGAQPPPPGHHSLSKILFPYMAVGSRDIIDVAPKKRVWRGSK